MGRLVPRKVMNLETSRKKYPVSTVIARIYCSHNLNKQAKFNWKYLIGAPQFTSIGAPHEFAKFKLISFYTKFCFLGLTPSPSLEHERRHKWCDFVWELSAIIHLRYAILKNKVHERDWRNELNYRSQIKRVSTSNNENTANTLKCQLPQDPCVCCLDRSVYVLIHTPDV